MDTAKDTSAETSQSQAQIDQSKEETITIESLKDQLSKVEEALLKNFAEFEGMESNNPNKRIILESIERGKLSKEQIIEKIGNIQKRSAVTITIEGVTKDSTSDFPENDPRNIGNLEVEQDTRIIRSRDLELEQEINKISLQLAFATCQPF